MSFFFVNIRLLILYDTSIYAKISFQKISKYLGGDFFNSSPSRSDDPYQHYMKEKKEEEEGEEEKIDEIK